jgi:hypothetical protein
METVAKVTGTATGRTHKRSAKEDGMKRIVLGMGVACGLLGLSWAVQGHVGRLDVPFEASLSYHALFE